MSGTRASFCFRLEVTYRENISKVSPKAYGGVFIAAYVWGYTFVPFANSCAIVSEPFCPAFFLNCLHFLDVIWSFIALLPQLPGCEMTSSHTKHCIPGHPSGVVG